MAASNFCISHRFYSDHIAKELVLYFRSIVYRDLNFMVSKDSETWQNQASFKTEAISVERLQREYLNTQQEQ